MKKTAVDTLVDFFTQDVPARQELAVLGIVFLVFGIAVMTQLPSVAENSNAFQARLFGTSQSRTIEVVRVPSTVDSSATIQRAIDSTSPGDTVYFPSGAYFVSKPISFKSDVTYLGSMDSNGYVNSRIIASTSDKFLSLPKSGLAKATFKNLRFESVALSFENSVWLYFDNCFFYKGVNSKLDDPSETFQLDFTGASSDITITNTVFYRPNIGDAGRGVRLYSSKNVGIKNNRFIGYYRTAINVMGYSGNATSTKPTQLSTNTIISGNTISRFSDAYAEDHGIYAWNMDGLEISKNAIKGWSLTQSGYAIKITNGKNVSVTENTLTHSGILAYVYSTFDLERTQYLENVRIANNLIDQTYYSTTTTSKEPMKDLPAIQYWWTKSNPETGSAAPAPYEKSFVIESNTVKNGSIKIVAPRTPAEFSVLNNTGAFAYILPTGVVSSGNK